MESKGLHAVEIDAGDLAAAVPDLTGTVVLPGLEGEVTVWRDAFSVPHVRATTPNDAFFAQGYVHAQDRLWQMDVDRHRADGRWAQWAGPAWLEHDIFMRRLGLTAAARADHDAFDTETTAMFAAYAAGVNAFIDTSPVLPAEYRMVDASPEPWQPWDGCSIYKVRHILMGSMGVKLWRARLMQRVGAEVLMTLRADAHVRGPVISAPDGLDSVLADDPHALDGAEAVAALWEWVGGSNNWVVAGERTASGHPLLAGDPHRGLETPNVYYQNHVACPDFDVIGYSFAGVPGFPHFGHNADVAWGITHGMADTDDFFVERFDPADPTRYEFQGEWLTAQRRRETIDVRGAESVEIGVTVTHHGPIVIGDPRRGHALAVRCAASASTNAGLTAVAPMMRARTVAELDATMRPWVDPVNNLVMADRDGAIAYMTRGDVPIRDAANAWLPVPGWTGEHEWQGSIPFEELPRAKDPARGFIVTANHRITTDDSPHHISLDFYGPHRAQRIEARLSTLTAATVGDMASVHAERVSLPSRAFMARLDALTLPDGLAVDARRILADWNGAMDPTQIGPSIYAVWRERTTALVVERGPLQAMTTVGEGENPLPLQPLSLASRLRSAIAVLIAEDDTTLLAQGAGWNDLLADAFVLAVEWLRAHCGDDPAQWTWGALHRTAPAHTLAGAFPALAELLNPPSVPMGGDADTPHAAFSDGLTDDGFLVPVASVTRYCFDLANWDNSGWVVPLGASGHPGSAHYADQAPAWRDVHLHPMRYSWDVIADEAATRQHLVPG